MPKTSFITKLLHGQPDLNPEPYLSIENELIPDVKQLAVAATIENVEIRMRHLLADKDYLVDTIAQLSEELRQTEIALEAMTAAHNILHSPRIAAG